MQLQKVYKVKQQQQQQQNTYYKLLFSSTIVNKNCFCKSKPSIISSILTHALLNNKLLNT